MSKSRHLFKEHNLAEVFTVVYALLDDYLKAAGANCRFVLPTSEQQKGSCSELMTIATVGDLLNQADVGLWFNLVESEYKQLFPELPDESRYYRILNNLERIWADFALLLIAEHTSFTYSLDSKPLPLCTFKRHQRPRAMTGATVGYSSHGAIYGFKLHAVSSTAGMIVKFAITPAHQADVTVARTLMSHLERTLTLGDKPTSVQRYTPRLKLMRSTPASGLRSWTSPESSSSLFSPP